MPTLRIVFAGTPEFAVPAVEAVCASRHELVAVYTQPDRPAGRGRRLRPGPVKRFALDRGLPVLQPRTLRSKAACQQLAALRPDLMVVVAYGLILPVTVLAIPGLGCVNLHASLLPRWRGAAPIQRAILAGDRRSGVCLMRMDEGLDTGPVLARVACDIAPTMTGGELHDRLARLGAELLAENLEALAAGELKPWPQPREGVCYAAKIDKAEARLDWSGDAGLLQRQVLAFNPFPVAETGWQGRRLRIWRAVAREGGPGACAAAPGTVLAESRTAIRVACGSGVLDLLELQLPGRRALPVADFLNAHSLLGAVLG